MTAFIAVAIAGLAIYLYGLWLDTPSVDEMVARALADEEDAVLRMANEDRIGPAAAAWLAQHGAADIDREWAELNGRDAA